MANVADDDTPDRDAVEAVERWFPSRGIPHYVLTDATYRKELLDEVLVALRQAFAVRALYLAAGAGSRA